MGYNKVKCLACGEVLESKSRHDFVMCDCENETFVDGSSYYARCGGKKLELVAVVETSDNTFTRELERGRLITLITGLEVTVSEGKKCLNRNLHALLWIEKGIRIGTIIEWQGAEYQITQVKFPYGYNKDNYGCVCPELKGGKRKKNGEFSRNEVCIWDYESRPIKVLDKTE